MAGLQKRQSLQDSRYDETRGEKRLLSGNEAYRPIVIKPGDDVELYGIVIRTTSER